MNYLVHCSNPNLGGAEKSVAEHFLSEFDKKGPVFLLPEIGPLSQFLLTHGISFHILPWPPGMNRFSQRKLNSQWLYSLLLPVYIIPWLSYLIKFKKRINQSDVLFSSGIKSHCICLLIGFVIRQKIIFNIRDFIDPRWLRKFLSLMCRLRGIQIEANSKAVGRDYYKPKIKYPIVEMGFEKKLIEKKESPLIISHVAFFAPYKGQELFLEYARKILDRGIQAQFWLIGDVIYPGAFYKKYRHNVLQKVSKLNLEQYVKVLGRVNNPLEYLARSHLLLHCTLEPEPFGRVIIESLKSGCDVICHKSNGCLEVIENIDDVEKSMLSGIVDGEKYCFMESAKIRIVYPD